MLSTIALPPPFFAVTDIEDDIMEQDYVGGSTYTGAYEHIIREMRSPTIPAVYERVTALRASTQTAEFRRHNHAEPMSPERPVVDIHTYRNVEDDIMEDDYVGGSTYTGAYQHIIRDRGAPPLRSPTRTAADERMAASRAATQTAELRRHNQVEPISPDRPVVDIHTPASVEVTDIVEDDILENDYIRRCTGRYDHIIRESRASCRSPTIGTTAYERMAATSRRADYENPFYGSRHVNVIVVNNAAPSADSQTNARRNTGVSIDGCRVMFH